MFCCGVVFDVCCLWAFVQISAVSSVSSILDHTLVRVAHFIFLIRNLIFSCIHVFFFFCKMKGYLEIQNLKSRAWKVFDVNEKVCFQFKKKHYWKMFWFNFYLNTCLICVHQSTSLYTYVCLNFFILYLTVVLDLYVFFNCGHFGSFPFPCFLYLNIVPHVSYLFSSYIFCLIITECVRERRRFL